MKIEEMWYLTIKPSLNTIYNTDISDKDAVATLKHIIKWLEEREE